MTSKICALASIIALFGCAIICAPPAQAAVNDWTSLVQFPSIVTALAIDPASPSTLYAGTNENGVFKSTDGGQNWSATGMTSGLVRCFAIDPSVTSTIYAAHTGVTGGVYKSTDGGVIWNPMNTGLTTFSIISSNACLAIDPTMPSTLYFGTNGGGVFKSTNGGANWSAVNTGLTNLNILVLRLDPSAPSTLFAGTAGGGVFKSTDGGASWGTSNAGLLTSLNVVAIVIDPVTPSTLYLSTADGVFRSTDSGQTWILRDYSVYASLAVDPLNSGTLYAYGIDFLDRTVNGWATRSSLFTPSFTDTTPLSLALDPSAPNIYAGTGDGYVFKVQVDLCQTNADCDDGESSTVDACDPADYSCGIAGCIHVPLPPQQDALKMILKQSTASGKEKAVWVSKNPPIVLPASSPITAGATLRVIGTNQDATVSLPAGAANWKTNAGSTLYKFVNKLAPGGPSPCKVALIKSTTVLKVVCKDSIIDLDDPTQGTVSMVLTVGADSYCSTCTGAAINKDEPGKFIAKLCPAPGVCPGATTTTTTTAAPTTTTSTTVIATTSTTTTTTISGSPSRAFLAGTLDLLD